MTWHDVLATVDTAIEERNKMRTSDLDHMRGLHLIAYCSKCGGAMDGQSYLACTTCLKKYKDDDEPDPCKFCVVCGTEKPVEYRGSLSDILCMSHSVLIIQTFEREREVFRCVRSQVLVRDMTRACSGAYEKGSGEHNELLKRIYEDAALLDSSYVGSNKV